MIFALYDLSIWFNRSFLQQTALPRLPLGFTGGREREREGEKEVSSVDEKEVAGADQKQVAGAGDKQVVEETHLPEAIDEESGKEVVRHSVLPRTYERSSGQLNLLNRFVWNKRAKWISVAIISTALLAIGLGVGLGLGLQSAPKSPRMPEGSFQAIGGALDSEYYSTMGAFNGTGMALSAQTFPGDGEHGRLVLYFQHWTGQIRYLESNGSGDWIGGNAATTVATDAKNNTPISTVSYVVNHSSQWHVYYINQQNMVRERFNGNDTGIWQDGVINGLQVTAMAAEQTGLLACWLGGNPEIDLGSNASDNVGVRLWYASNSTTFAQLGWQHGYNAWEYEQSLAGLNGYTSPACYSWAAGTTTYTIFADLYGAINIYWQDTAWNTVSTAEHPINVWVNSSIAVPGVRGAAQLAYTNCLYGQSEEDQMIRGYNISWAAENSTVLSGSEFVVGSEAGVPGTRLAASELFGNDGSKQLVIFFQTNGSDITQFSRDLSGNTWTRKSLPIPQD